MKNLLANSPFATDLGFDVIEWTQGKAVVSVELTERMRNSHGVGHGGVTATLIDVALGIACRSVAGDWASQGTISLNLHFLAPASGYLVAEGRLLKAGKEIAFCDGEVRNKDGKIIAKATATFKIKRRIHKEETSEPRR